MNWLGHYEKLIEKRKKDIPEGYTENHHIFPKSRGGLKIPENMVRLTAKEHLIAHFLLVKIYPEDAKLIHAAFSMSNNKRYGSRKYAWLKEKYSESKIGISRSKEDRKKMSESQKSSPKCRENLKKWHESRKGISLSEEHRKKVSEGLKGIKRSEEHCRNISKSKLGKNTGPLSEEHRNNISKSLKGIPRSKEARSRISDGIKRAHKIREILKIWNSAL